MNFRDRIRKILPPFLQDRPGMNVGFRVMYSIALIYDVFAEALTQGQNARFPGVGTATALPMIGRDRRIIRGPRETDEGYADRLEHWLDEKPFAGGAYGMMRQIQAFFAPGKPRVRIVLRRGTWYTLDPDGTFTRYVASPNNWDWDSISHPGRASNTTDWWMVIYPPHAETDGDWGDTGTWGDPGAFGVQLDMGDATALLEIIRECGGVSYLSSLIFSYDEAQFDPALPPGDPLLPDGRWGNWGKLDGSDYVPSRFTDCRYLENQG